MMAKYIFKSFYIYLTLTYWSCYQFYSYDNHYSFKIVWRDMIPFCFSLCRSFSCTSPVSSAPLFSGLHDLEHVKTLLHYYFMKQSRNLTSSEEASNMPIFTDICVLCNKLIKIDKILKYLFKSKAVSVFFWILNKEIFQYL